MTLTKIASKIASSMESIYVVIYGPRPPNNFSEEDAVKHAKNLIPCKTGDFHLVDYGNGWYSGNLEFETGYYDSSDDYVKLGPDKDGFTVEWEKP